MTGAGAAAKASAAAAALLLTALLVLGEPWSRTESHAVRGVLALLAVVGLCVRVLLPAGASAWFRGALAVVVVFAWVNYWNRSKEAFFGVTDYSDVTFYYLNSKYLPELGYYGLYPAMILADQETSNRHAAHIVQVRDLRTDALVPVAAVAAQGAILKTHFMIERWDAFRHDNDVLQSRQSRAELAYIYEDHGYNPPPTWSLVGGAVASLVPVEALKVATALDGILVVAAFAAVGATFGGETALWAMLWFTVTFSGRWPVLGQALLRFDWLCALIGAMCALRRDRYGLAGALLGYATLSRLFPALFLGAWLCEALGDGWRERRISPRHLRFAAAAGGMVGLTTAFALARYGWVTCRESLANLVLHGQSFSSHRLGAGVIATWRGEFTRAALRAAGGMAEREQAVQALQPFLLGIAVALVALLAGFALRSRRPAWEILPWLILPLFVATNPQVNYWNLRVLAVVWHAHHLTGGAGPGRDRPFHLAGLALLFATEAMAQLVFSLGYERHAVHAIGSWGLAIWGATLLGWLTCTRARGGGGSDTGALPCALEET